MLAGCASSGGYAESASYDPEPTRAEQSYLMADDYGYENGDWYDESYDDVIESKPTSYSDKKPVAEDRKRIYSGSVSLVVDDVIETKTGIAEEVDRIQGYVESSYDNYIIIRVPADQFESTMEYLQNLGSVSYKSVETADVTEFYSDLSTRLDIAEKTRERYYALLEKTEDVEERLRILREIRRLTEEIERMNLVLQGIDQQIAFSRITITLEPRLSNESALRQDIPFWWMGQLNPLYVALDRLEKNVIIDLGDSFAVFERKWLSDDHYYAESSDGVRVKIGQTDNDPEGGPEFWQNALIHHLGPIYAEAETVNLGSLNCVLFTSKDTEPFYYLVGLYTTTDDIIVVEVFFPDDKAKKDNYPSIEKALTDMKVE